jgi:hypothetical protein
MTRWWRESLLLLRGAPSAFVVLYLMLLALNMTWQPLILNIPITCGVIAIIFAAAMSVHQGNTGISDVWRSIRDVPWWPLSRLVLDVTLLVVAVLIVALTFRYYLSNIIDQDRLSSAATLHHLHSSDWKRLPIWMRLLIINGFGTTQTILGNVFLLLSVGAIVAGLTRHAYLAMIAGFQAIMVNMRVWMFFMLASLSLQGVVTFLSARLHTFGAALLVSVMGVALLLLVGLYGWCFVREAFGLPGARVSERKKVAVRQAAFGHL